MARPAKPWYRKSRDAWFVMHRGKQVMLAKGKANRATAYREFLKLMDRHDPEVAAKGSAMQVCELFLVYARANLKPKTLTGYTHYLTKFCEGIADMDANAVMPKHVTDFLNLHPNWSSTSRYNAIRYIKRALAEGHITVNQIKNMQRPRPQRRDTIPDEKEMERFIACANPAYRELLTFLRHTGCRPGEAALILKQA